MKILLSLSLVLVCSAVSARAQSLGNAGTIEGTVVDPSGAAVGKAQVTLRNAVSGYDQTTTTGDDGAFRLSNIPNNPYHLEIIAQGFNTFGQEVDVRNSVPVQLKASLALAGTQTSVQVEGALEALETDPSAHVDVDRSLMLKLPAFDAAGSLSQAITYSTGGVAADGNGLFHPLGDHAQAAFVIDGQPISDQQSKVFSTQLPTSAIQSMEVTTGTPAAEFGDKSSLVAQITTRSGLGAGRVFGNLDATYGSFGTVGGSAGLGFGTAKLGNFLAVDGLRTGRFLDTPEFRPLHDIGNIANHLRPVRLSAQRAGRVSLEPFRGAELVSDSQQLRSGGDQPGSAPAGADVEYRAGLSAHVQHAHAADDQSVHPERSGELLCQPRSVRRHAGNADQNRQLLNWGVKADIATTQGRNNLKYGLDLKQTRLLENFGFGITDPGFNDPCINPDGTSVGDPALTNPGQCAAAGYEPNTADNPDSVVPFSPALLAYDLTRNGKLFNFHAASNINQYAFYAQDGITLGNLEFNDRVPAGPLRWADRRRPVLNRGRASLTHQRHGDRSARRIRPNV